VFIVTARNAADMEMVGQHSCSVWKQLLVPTHLWLTVNLQRVITDDGH
jgi:hypothetical protein